MLQRHFQVNKSRPASLKLGRRAFSAVKPPRSLTCYAAIKLYTNPGSRGKIPEWYLGELGLEYEPVLLDMRRGEHKTPAFLQINPFGKVPALTDGDIKVFESGAILLHLANKYGKLSEEEMATAAQWTLFANSTLSDAFFNGAQRTTQMPIMLATLDKILTTKPYLAGDAFSVGDVAVGSYLLYLPLFFPDLDLTKYPAVWSYMQKLAERPACPAPYKEAMEEALAAAKARSGAGGVLGKIFSR